jgi:hypothetical protein
MKTTSPMRYETDSISLPMQMKAISRAARFCQVVHGGTSGRPELLLTTITRVSSDLAP